MSRKAIMHIVGQEEIDAVTRVIRSGALFRCGENSECERFERRCAEYLGCRHFALTVSGTYALTAAMPGSAPAPAMRS